MASFNSGSDSDPYGYDLTISDEERLIAVVDTLSPPPRRARAQASGAARVSQGSPSKTRSSRTVSGSSSSSSSSSSGSSSLDSHFKAAIAVHETLEQIGEGDLDFDINELESERAYSHGSGSGLDVPPRRAQPPAIQRWLAPSVSSDNRSLASFVSRTKPRSTASVLSERSVRYPDREFPFISVPLVICLTDPKRLVSRALSDARKNSDSPAESDEQENPPPRPPGDNLSPIIRWRSFPKKPLSVTDLTAGVWCELQHFYVLDRRGGRRFKTAAMKAGSVIHDRLEREIYKPVEVDIVKREDAFGLKIWNIIQGLRTLRDTGQTREMEVWGFVEGQLVNGIVDGLSYTNPDIELEEDVISERGSQSSQSSQHQLSLGNRMIFVTDVKTRSSKTPPPQTQVRGAIIQLFLYHRFLSDMASGKLDYLRVFARYGLNPDETFSDSFMAKMASLYDDILSDNESDLDSDATERTETTADFVTAVSTPSQIGDRLSDLVYMKYRTLRSLIPLLKFEVQITFPRGAATLGQIVAVEYRYRARSAADENGGSVICTNTFFVEPEKLDAYLQDNMQWWRGEREPRGVGIEEGFKCGTCEFVEECDWRINLDQEMLRKAKRKSSEREAKRGGGRQKKSGDVEW